MTSFTQLRKDKNKLIFSRAYYAFPEGIEVIIIGEMDGERRGENEIILKCVGSHERINIRDELFWQYISKPDEAD